MALKMLQRQAKIAASADGIQMAVPRVAASCVRKASRVPVAFNAPVRQQSVAGTRALSVKVSASASTPATSAKPSGLKIDLTGERCPQPSC